MLSKTFIDGKILRNPEKRYTSNNVPILTFKLIHQEKMELDITAYGKSAEHLSEVLKAGQNVLIEGCLENTKYNEKTKLLVNAKGINILEAINADEIIGEDEIPF